MKNRKKLLLIVILLAIFSLIILIIYLLEPQPSYPIIFLGDEHNLPQSKNEDYENFQKQIKTGPRVYLYGEYDKRFVEGSSLEGTFTVMREDLLVSFCTDTECKTELYPITTNYITEKPPKKTPYKYQQNYYLKM